jgi:ribulose bisphosphate carboxylase small subunit
MERYIVISHHTGEDCVKALKQVLAIGYLTHYEWGCKDGVHTGWAILEAENKGEAMLSVPTFLRDKAQVVRLVQFDPDRVQKMHE